MLLGLAFIAPAVVVVPFAPTAGLGLALGVLPAAIVPLPARRSRRLLLIFIGALAGVGILCGSLLSRVPIVAVPALFLFCVAASLASRAGPAGRMILVLVLPLTAIGLSYSDVETAATTAVLMVMGSMWAFLVSLLWPESEPGRAELFTMSRSAAIGYGIRLGCAGAGAATVGFLLGLEHVGWACGAALLVMRPSEELLMSRAIGRATSVVLGALAGAAFMVTTPPAWLLAAAIGAVFALLGGTQGSRWYITSAFTTFVVFTLLLWQQPDDSAFRFWERILETGLGVGLALLFGIAVPHFAAKLAVRPA